MQRFHKRSSANNKKVEGIIFDFDGVIVNSEPFWEMADRIIVEQAGKSYIEEAKYRIMGLSPVDSILRLMEIHNISGEPEAILERRADIMKEFYDTRIELNDYAGDVLGFLYERGMRLALASSTPRKIFAGALERLDIEKFFEVIITSEDVKRSKPDPEIFIKAHKMLRIPRDRLIIIEDSDAGVEGAIASGIRVVWLKNNNTRLKNENSPDFTIDMLNEIMAFIT